MNHPAASRIGRSLFRLPTTSVRYPIAALSVLVAIAGIAGLGLTRLELRTDGHALVPKGDPVVLTDNRVRDQFGVRDPIVVYLETSGPDGVYNLPTLERLQELGLALAALPQLRPEDLTSLATERRPRVYTGTLRFRPFFDPMPDTPVRMDYLREDVDRVDILDGTLITEDRRGLAILVGAPPSRSRQPDGVDRRALHRDIEAVVARFEVPGERIRVVGAPIAESLLGEHIIEDLVRLVPLAMLGVSLVIWWSCRRVWGAAIVLMEVGACLVFTFGLMGWLGVPVYLTTGVLPVILISIGIADELHVLLYYQRQLGQGSNRDEAVTSTMRAMVRPVSLTSLTTALGFLSFCIAPIDSVVAFGVFAAIGIGFCWLWTLVAVPACLILSPEASLARKAPTRATRDWLPSVYRALLSRPQTVLMGFGGLTLVLAAGTFGLYVQDSWIDGFASNSPFRRATEYVDGRLNGTHTLLIEVAFDPERSWPHLPRKFAMRNGPFLDQRVYEAIGRIEAELRLVPGVGGVLGPYRHLTMVHHVYMAGQPGSRSIPEKPERLAYLLDRYDQARGEHRRREVIHDDLHRGLIQVLVRGANYRETAVLMERAQLAAAEHLSPLGGEITFAGDLAVSQAMIPAIVRTQLGSLALALLGALACVALVLRSRRTALLALAPTAIAVLWLLGVMGWLGMPIGVATSTFCAVSLGIGIDYAIHYLERLREARDAPYLAQIEAAGRVVAPAVLADAFAVSIGFGALAFSVVPATARLGIVVGLALPAAALLTLVGLPALLIWLNTRGGRC
jgi:hypothetical protein